MHLYLLNMEIGLKNPAIQIRKRNYVNFPTNVSSTQEWSIHPRSVGDYGYEATIVEIMPLQYNIMYLNKVKIQLHTSLSIAPSKYVLVRTWNRPSLFVWWREWLRIALETATANFSCSCRAWEPEITITSCPAWTIFFTWKTPRSMHGGCNNWGHKVKKIDIYMPRRSLINSYVYFILYKQAQTYFGLE